MTTKTRGPRVRHLTDAKIRRALDALIDVMQTEEGRAAFDNGLLDAACDHIRKLGERVPR